MDTAVTFGTCLVVVLFETVHTLLFLLNLQQHGSLGDYKYLSHLHFVAGYYVSRNLELRGCLFSVLSHCNMPCVVSWKDVTVLTIQIVAIFTVQLLIDFYVKKF